jgi:hypothetical protein
MLGVFCCVPAFDRFFRIGFGGAKLNRETLTTISDFYLANKDVLHAVPIRTLDFMTGRDTSRWYTQGKIIDMIFFEEGYRRTGQVRNRNPIWPSAISASPGARAFYDTRRAVGDTHNAALRALGNRLVGILHGCLAHHTPYSETTAWEHRTNPCGVPEVCLACELQRCTGSPVGHDDQPCPSVCSI